METNPFGLKNTVNLTRDTHFVLVKIERHRFQEKSKPAKQLRERLKCVELEGMKCAREDEVVMLTFVSIIHLCECALKPIQCLGTRMLLMSFGNIII